MPPDLYRPGSSYHIARRRYAPAAVRCLDLAMEQLGKPVSMLDVGCGEGALVQWCRDDGLDAWGVDLAVPDGLGLFTRDLRHQLTLNRTFEWVLCWEVAEHLPQAFAGTLCDSLVRHLAGPQGRLIFTAAQPGQRGPGHVNCQPKSYWGALLLDRGLTWMRHETSALETQWRTVTSAPWYARNVMVMAWA